MKPFASPLVVCLAAAVVASASAAAEPIEYNRDVRPILAETCFACHGPDSAARQADLRLDKRKSAVESEAIVPGEPDDSEMIARIYATAADEIMPPPKSHKTLTDEAARDAPALGGRRGRVPAALVADCAAAAGAARGEEQAMGPQSDRPFHTG